MSIDAGTGRARHDRCVAGGEPAGRRRGRAGALTVLTASSAGAGILSPLVAGMLLDAAETPEAGYTAAFLVFGGLVAIGGLLSATFVDPERDRHPSIPNTRGAPCLTC